MENNDLLQEKADPERNHDRRLLHLSLGKYHWFGSSSMSEHPDDQPREVQPGEVTIASRMPNPVVHYRARIVVTAEVATTSDQSEVSRGVPVAPSHGQRSGSSSPKTWGSRIADEDMDLVLGQLFPTRGLRIEEPMMTEREQRGSKRPSDQDRMARLQKIAKTSDGGKSRARASAAATSSRAGPLVPTKAPSDPLEVWVSHLRDERPAAIVPSSRSW
ncbi:hypothetical protein TIFTF001_034378 [Ficus carica]|uniref:Uncharacterized protein n=1 Tax=Ficus carica TaxID=3494 RepID=A0AA88E171_FICCA|nr:hypothetical protein TIFTF001_034378 [Ficus carica]